MGRGHAVTPLRLVVTGKDRLTLYVEPKSEERDDRLTPHVWVSAIRFERRKTGLGELSRRWTQLTSVVSGGRSEGV